MRAPFGALMLLGSAAANPNKFETTSPGGDTTCFNGGAYSFMHRKGTVKKLVIEMEGGGACWSDATCNPVKALCTTSVSKGKAASLTSGMHDGTNPKNAFAEWYHVFVPYCSCDIHSGLNDKKYILGNKHHKGHINFMSALNWTKANFPTDMETVTISGCSAGSAGAFINWPFIANEYPNAQHSVFGDSYIGVFAEAQWNKCFENWKIQLPTFVPGINNAKLAKWFDGISCYTQEMGAKWMPKAELGWYTSNADVVQTSFYTIGGGAVGSWTKTMRQLDQCYLHNTTNVHTFIAKGSAHCRSQDNGYYSVTSDKTNLAQWVGDLVTGKTPVENVDCVADGECKAKEDAEARMDLTGYADHLPYRK